MDSTPNAHQGPRAGTDTAVPGSRLLASLDPPPLSVSSVLGYLQGLVRSPAPGDSPAPLTASILESSHNRM